MLNSWLMRYFTDSQYLTFLEQKIARLIKLVERQETIGVQISSVGGNYRSYLDLDKLNKQLPNTMPKENPNHGQPDHARAQPFRFQTTGRQVRADLKVRGTPFLLIRVVSKPCALPYLISLIGLPNHFKN